MDQIKITIEYGAEAQRSEYGTQTYDQLAAAEIRVTPVDDADKARIAALVVAAAHQIIVKQQASGRVVGAIDTLLSRIEASTAAEAEPTEGHDPAFSEDAAKDQTSGREDPLPV